MIKNIIFDFGGVIVTLEPRQAVERFAALGLPDAETHLDAYTQSGIFGALEEGKIDRETFRKELSRLCGRDISHEECRWAWLGYAKEVPQRNIEALKELRRRGYRLIMLSNTNEYMMSWAMSKEFSRNLDAECLEGKAAREYFDAAYLSYEVGYMKPDERFFKHVLHSEGITPEESLFLDDGKRNVEAAGALGINTMLTVNGEDWVEKLLAMSPKL